MTKVSIRGAPRSGTHLAEHWIFSHFDGVKAKGNYRHSDYHFPRDGDRLLVMVKHPYPWLVSMWRWVETWRTTEEPFPVDKLRLVPSTIFAEFCRANPGLVYYWNDRNDYWLDVEAEHKFFCRYDRLIQDPEKALGEIGEWLGFEQSRPFEGFPEESVPSLALGAKNRRGPFDPAYYLERQWRDEYDDDLRREVEKRFDHTLLQRLGI